MELTLTVTKQEAALILIGLQEIPAKLANPLTEKLKKQISDVLPAQAEETE